MTSFKHHGVKGQKWGVRNGPPYPIEDKILKKGTRLNSVSSKWYTTEKYRNQGRSIYTYREDDKWDNKVYKGPFSEYLVWRGATYIAEHSFETTKDLRMPTSKERKQAFYDMLEDKKTSKIVKKDLKDEIRHMKNHNVGSVEAQNLNVNNIKTDKDKAAAYEAFNHVLEEIYKHPSGKIYMDIMSKNYEAMVDDNNVNVYNEAHDPIIIFRGDLYLKSLTKNGRILTSNEIIKNIDDVSKELAKKGKHYAL